MKKKKKVMFNGKPMGYWEQMAHEMVVEVLVRAAVTYDHPLSSLPQQLAAKRLWELIKAEGPKTAKKLLEERERCFDGIAKIMNDLRP
jgi:hypothetical protein